MQGTQLNALEAAAKLIAAGSSLWAGAEVLVQAPGSSAQVQVQMWPSGLSCIEVMRVDAQFKFGRLPARALLRHPAKDPKGLRKSVWDREIAMAGSGPVNHGRDIHKPCHYSLHTEKHL